MAQLRHDYDQFRALNTEVLVMVPNGPKMIERHVKASSTPYPILTDKGSKTAEAYFQIKKFFLAGTPTVFLVDRTGCIHYAHYATSVIEEPDNREPLAVLAGELRRCPQRTGSEKGPRPESQPAVRWPADGETLP